MKQCLLHLGLQKTGTTSIQESLHLNRDYLRTKSVYYPELVLGGRLLSHDACHILQSVTREYEQIPALWKLERSPLELRDCGLAILDALIDDFRESGCSTLLISSELLPGPYLPSFFDILREDVGPLKGVLYLRSPLPHFRSTFQQRLRAGRLMKESGSDSVRSLISQLQSCLGGGLELRKYLEKNEDKHWNAVDDFWTYVLNVPRPRTALVPPLNEADPAEISILFAVVTERLERWSRDEKQIFFIWCRNKIQEMDLKELEYAHFEFSREIEQMVLAATAPDCIWLEQEFGVRWAGIEQLEQLDSTRQIIPSAEYLRSEVRHSPETCATIARRLLDQIRTGVPKGINAAEAEDAVVSAIEVFRNRHPS